MNHVLSGFEKAAGLGTLVPKLLTGLKSMGSQLASGGARVTHGAVAAGGSLGKSPLGKDLIYRGPNIVRNRMIRRGIGGAVVGAGGSMLQQKLRGEEISLGRAAKGALIGGGIGAALGTTAGARGFRRLTAPSSTPDLSLGKSMNWFKAGPDVKAVRTSAAASRSFPAGSTVSRGRTAFGNLSPVDKGFLAMSGVDAVRAATSKDHEGHRGEGIGSAIGSAAGMLTGSRWKALRGARKGSLVKSLGLYGGSSILGGAIGKGFDPKPPQEVPGV